MKREQLIAPEIYNLSQEVEAFAKDQGRIAIKWTNGTGRIDVTYSQLVLKANQFANALLNSGLQRGDKVLLILPRIPEAYFTYLACLKVGLVIIPCSEMLRAKDLSYRINHAEARAVIAHSEVIAEVDRIEGGIPTLQYKWVIGEQSEGWLDLVKVAREESDELTIDTTSRDDMAFLAYTSGTTGNPKAVVHTHGWAYAHLQTASKKWLGVRAGDLVWATAAPGWQKWIWSPFLSTIGLGATAYVYHGKFDAQTYLQKLQDEKITVLCCTPTEYRLMISVNELEKFDLTHVRSAVSAGEPLNKQVIETFKKTFNLDVRDGYGQTESTLLIGTMEGMEIKPGSMGKPTPGNKVAIIDENGNEVKKGEVGDIAVHQDAPALFKGYYRDAEKTAMTYRGEYYLTGDRAKQDEEGYFWYEGRRDDIIISSGYTIGPFEVEDALTKHPLVQECAVVASPDETRGNVVKAFVILNDPTIKDENQLIQTLQEHVKTLTAPYKYPRRIEFVKELPKTISGKIRRIELREEEKKRYNY